MTAAQNNRSMPEAVVTPVLMYPDVIEAAEWLCRSFGFRERLRIGDHRVQLRVGKGGTIVAAKISADAAGPDSSTNRTHSVMVRVPDVDRHHETAALNGAKILTRPTDHPFGERQYSAEDIGGHAWTFSETIADIDPTLWGAIVPES